MAKEKIVVIDDSPIVRKLAELALEEEGYKVYTAEDGEEGLRISEEVRPSVILVDFIMPRISGYQFCKSARENELL
jgi:CheY-like chemotaxis protein